MPLLNYTTTIDPVKSIAEITRCLVAHGAREIMTGYGADGRPASIGFVVPTPFGDRSFRLPANVDAVEATLKAQNRKGKVPPKFATREHASRVAWRIVKDWLEAQMAIIESGMVTLNEVMLPYMLDGRDRTFYQVVVERHLALPGPEGGEG